MKNRSIWMFVLTILVVSNYAYSQSLSYLNYIPSDIEVGDTITDTVNGISLEGNLLNTSSLQSVVVYLPPNYDKLSRNYYPVLYLLLGYGGDHDDYYRLSQLLERLNELITSQKMKPMIVVTPNSKNAYLGSYFSNSYVTGNWEDFIAYDLIHHIDSVYNVNSNKNARGLSGFSMGGYGTLKIGMKHPSVFGTIGSLSAGPADFNEFFSNYLKPYLIYAAKIKEFSKANNWQTQICFATAAAFAPDSTEVPSLCRFPYNEAGERIDSIWQQWLVHDPLSMISIYKDSILSLNSILMYIGNTDEFFYTGNKSFHQTLLENNITHTYREFNGGHVLNPILNDVLQYYSDNLDNSIPTILNRSEYYLESDDSVRVKSDVDGTVFIIPYDCTNNFENIINDHVFSTIAFADSLLQIPLSGLDYDKYQMFAMSQDSSLSNLPAEFCLVPDKSPPEFSIERDTVLLSDSVMISSDRDGTLCFIGSYSGIETFQTADEIVNSSRPVHFELIRGDEDYYFDAKKLEPRSYHVYCYDTYGFLSGPKDLTIIDNTFIDYTNIQNSLQLYPNPVHGELNITLTDIDSDITFYSESGQKILELNDIKSNFTFDLSSFPKGVFFITIRSKDFVTTRKIIKL